jgi:SAM-dependent methyltransferase
MLDGPLYLSPIPPSTNSVLDLGTGTGIWAIEFADEHPSTTVTGVDLSPVQPRWVPPNCKFEVDDVEADWTYPLPDPDGGGGQGFDYIHSRMLLLGLKDWPKLFRQSFEHLRPGGYFEAQEFLLNIHCEPDSPKQGTILKRWSDLVTGAAQKAGVKSRCIGDFHDWLTEAGFVDIQKRTFRWPIGPWPESKKEKTLGIWAQRNVLDGLEAATMGLMCRYEGWTKEQVNELIEEAKGEIMDMEYHQFVEL